MKPNLFVTAIIYSLALPALASAQVNPLTDLFSQTDASTSGKIIQYVVLLTVLSIAPSILIMVTSFTRFIIAFSFLRSAIGMQSTPASIIITSLSLFLTFFVMAPTFDKSWKEGLQPLLENKLTQDAAFNKIVGPFEAFMLAQVREKDLNLFKQLAAEKFAEGENQSDTQLRILVPSFMVSELRRGFEIGFLISLPFLIIDLIVATITMSMGMMMMPPSVIALPFKVLFFVLIDGWSMLAGSLVRSFS
jgi:flagellar biosynthesis protein FliP